jgi:Response regulator containing a CheY-like receiver domain and an HD-GYP domain
MRYATRTPPYLFISSARVCTQKQLENTQYLTLQEDANMKKYKLLLAGNSKKLITTFFTQMDSTFECMTSSIIYDDLKNHIQYFKPDMFVLCMRAETRDDLVTVASFHDVLIKNKIPYGVIGDSGSMDFASKIPNNIPELTLKLPIPTADLEDAITHFIRDHQVRLSTAQTPPATSGFSAGGSAFDALTQLDSMFDIAESEPTSSTDTELLNFDLKERPRILVVDDATIIHKTIKGYLDSKYEVATAINGNIALRFLKTKKVDLILLDYEMPDMNGPAVLEAVRADPRLASIPIVFLTGINDVEKTKSALALRPQGYLLKPVDKHALLNKIHELLL